MLLPVAAKEYCTTSATIKILRATRSGSAVKKRKTRITVETDRVLVIRGSKAPVTGWCDKCGGPVNMVTPDQAAVLARVSLRAIYRRVESETLHFVEMQHGSLLICINSLLNS